MTYENQKGFTLVELAIVMMIIGLLIGGVLKGQELLANARVTSTLSQVKGFEAAITSFQDTYSAMPGDMVNATSRLPNCTAGNNCIDGDGNSLVDDSAGGGGGNVVWTTNVTSWPEPTQFWKHLLLADLISGVTPDGDPNALAWGETHPKANIGGGFEFYYDSNMTNVGSAHLLRMSNQGLSGTVGVPGQSVLSPLRGGQMDRKMDDGNPNTGTVLANYGSNTDACKNTTTTYDEQSTRKNCTMFFVFNK